MWCRTGCLSNQVHGRVPANLLTLSDGVIE
jgi:hypothetical protein